MHDNDYDCRSYESNIKRGLDSGCKSRCPTRQCLKRENWLFKLCFTIPISIDYVQTPPEEQQRVRLYLEVGLNSVTNAGSSDCFDILGNWNFREGYGRNYLVFLCLLHVQ